MPEKREVREVRVKFNLDDIVGETTKAVNIEVENEGDPDDPLAHLTIVVEERPDDFKVNMLLTGRFGEAAVAAQKAAASLAQYAKKAGRF